MPFDAVRFFAMELTGSWIFGLYVSIAVWKPNGSYIPESKIVARGGLFLGGVLKI